MLRTRHVAKNHLLGDIVGHDAFTVSTSTLGVDNTLWNTLTSEMGQLVDQVEVSEDDWATWTSGHGVLVVVDWSTLRVCDYGSLHWKI